MRVTSQILPDPNNKATNWLPDVTNEESIAYWASRTADYLMIERRGAAFTGMSSYDTWGNTWSDVTVDEVTHRGMAALDASNMAEKMLNQRIFGEYSLRYGQGYGAKNESRLASSRLIPTLRDDYVMYGGAFGAGRMVMTRGDGESSPILATDLADKDSKDKTDIVISAWAHHYCSVVALMLWTAGSSATILEDNAPNSSNSALALYDVAHADVLAQVASSSGLGSAFSMLVNKMSKDALLASFDQSATDPLYVAMAAAKSWCSDTSNRMLAAPSTVNESILDQIIGVGKMGLTFALALWDGVTTVFSLETLKMIGNVLSNTWDAINGLFGRGPKWGHMVLGVESDSAKRPRTNGNDVDGMAVAEQESSIGNFPGSHRYAKVFEPRRVMPAAADGVKYWSPFVQIFTGSNWIEGDCAPEINGCCFEDAVIVKMQQPYDGGYYSADSFGFFDVMPISPQWKWFNGAKPCCATWGLAFKGSASHPHAVKNDVMLYAVNGSTNSLENVHSWGAAPTHLALLYSLGAEASVVMESKLIAWKRQALGSLGYQYLEYR